VLIVSPAQFSMLRPRLADGFQRLGVEEALDAQFQRRAQGAEGGLEQRGVGLVRQLACMSGGAVKNRRCVENGDILLGRRGHVDPEQTSMTR